MALYESEYTLFLKEMREKHPEWADEQREGMSILWDRPAVTPQEKEALGEAREAQRAYPYDVLFKP